MKITLVRHGKPTAAVNPKLSATGFAKWVRDYKLSKIDVRSLPPNHLTNSLTSHYIVSSNLPRAIDSAYLCTNKTPDLILTKIKEMDIPRYKCPFVLKAYTWLIMSRILWVLGFNGKVESFKTAKIRARNSANTLRSLAIKHENIVVFGHGMINKYIAKELTKQGWISVSTGKGYWSTTTLTIND